MHQISALNWHSLRYRRILSRKWGGIRLDEYIGWWDRHTPSQTILLSYSRLVIKVTQAACGEALLCCVVLLIHGGILRLHATRVIGPC
jgi:hypothetical protein